MAKQRPQDGRKSKGNGRRHHDPPVSPPPHKHREPDDDPVARYVEWTEHRYTPGYFLGGRLPPWVRGMQHPGPSGRLLGAVLIGVGLLEIVTVLAYHVSFHNSKALFLLVSFGAVSIAVGVGAFRRATRPRPTE